MSDLDNKDFDGVIFTKWVEKNLPMLEDIIQRTNIKIIWAMNDPVDESRSLEMGLIYYGEKGRHFGRINNDRIHFYNDLALKLL